MRRISGGVAASLAGLVTACLMAAPAQAEPHVGHDPAHDAHRVRGLDSTVARHHSLIDIRQVGVRHRLNRVTIRIRVRDLFMPQRPATISVRGYILVNPKARPRGDGIAWRWEATFRTSRPHKLFFGVLDAEHEESLGCFARSNSKFLRSELQYRRDVVFVSYPRRCIAPEGSGIRPRWVRVSATASAHLAGGREFIDNWVTPTDAGFVDPKEAHYTPRLHKGRHGR